MRYYDQENKRLVYIEKKATSEFWDHLWEDDALKKNILAGNQERFVFPTTKRYLKPGTKILEGGCGKGRYVYSLHARGYDVYGVDFAEKTVQKVNALIPELKIRLGDVRQLESPDAFFDGYWSLGVIEHFPEGYDSIAEEMLRVLKPGGYLFLTFPYMSLLRRLKVYFGSYPLFNNKHFDREHFYQFALNAPDVVNKFESLGFCLIKKRPYDGFKGLKDESGFLKPFFQALYDNKSFLVRASVYVLTLLLAPFTGHITLLVLKKK